MNGPRKRPVADEDVYGGKRGWKMEDGEMVEDEGELLYSTNAVRGRVRAEEIRSLDTMGLAV